MKSLRMTKMLIMLLGLGGVMVHAQENSRENFLLGQWARSPDECNRPEIVFFDDQAKIEIDVDGSPALFQYENIIYRLDAEHVLVELNGRHPYSKTLNQNALQFVLISKDVIGLQQLKNRGVNFVRCPF